MQRNFSTKELGFTAPQNEQIEMALTYGFTSIDIDISDFGRSVQSRGLEMARRLIDSAEMSIGTFRLPLSLNLADALFKSEMQKLPGLAHAAQSINATRTCAKIDPFSDTLAMPENYELYRKRLTEIQAALSECGITLGLEFVAPASARKDKKFEFIHSFDELVSLVDSVPNLGLVIDAWQLYASGKGVETLKKVKVEKIVCVRLADAPEDVAPGDLTMRNRLLPGETGVVDCAGFVKQLTEMGYEGPVTPMGDPSNFRGERRDMIAEMAGLRMKKLWVAAGLSEPEPEPYYPPVVEDEAEDSATAEDGADAEAETEAAAST